MQDELPRALARGSMKVPPPSLFVVSGIKQSEIPETVFKGKLGEKV